MPERPEPTEAMAFLRRKKIVETDAWTDFAPHEHAHAFTVAHSTGSGILDDLLGLLSEYQESGRRFDEFRQDAAKLMADRKWYGRKGITPDTPEGRRYITWRLRTIFDTNMNTAAAAGAYRQQLRVAEDRPWLVYKSLLVGNRRQSHKDMHNSAYPVGHPFWDTYYPPNGWGCKCDVVSMDDEDLERYGITKIEPSVPPRFARSVPQEWRYNVGQAAFTPDFSRFKHLATVVDSSGKSALRAVREAYIRDMQDVVLTEGELSEVLRSISRRDYRAFSVPYPIGVVSSEVMDALDDAGIAVSPGLSATDRDLVHAVRDTKDARGQRVPDGDIGAIHRAANDPESVWENTEPTHDRRELHFLSRTREGRQVKTVFHVDGPSLRFRTAALIDQGYDYKAHPEFVRVK